MSVVRRVVSLAVFGIVLSACGDGPAPQQQAGPAAGPASAGPALVPLEELQERALAAQQAGRLFDPPEDNAMALFLEISEREDVADADTSRRRRLVDSVGGGDLQQQAKLAMNDLFPQGLRRVEEALRANQLDDAGRIIAMLERARPDAPSVQGLRDLHVAAVRNARDNLRSTDLESLPPLVSKRIPTYPSRAERRGIEGWVHLSFAIQPDGTVADVKVMAAEPERVFDREAVEALKNWKFEAPGRVIQAQRRIEFSLAANEG